MIRYAFLLFLSQNALTINANSQNIKDYLSQRDSDFLFKMFQVRHIYEHNAGVIDDKFVKKLPDFASQIGRKYKLEKIELEQFLDKLSELMHCIYDEVE